ncbi:MAG: FGGY family carbohydrate kinase [Sphaerochaetaceae bacterium]
MAIISVDLGTTNTKSTLYDSHFNTIIQNSLPVTYLQSDTFTELDVDKYFSEIVELINYCSSNSNLNEEIEQIVFTGQAETLVIIDKNGNPMGSAISWLDQRSQKECDELNEHYKETCYEVTGNPVFIPTWPITKMLWLKQNNFHVFSNAHKFLLLKSYIVYKFTGTFAVDNTIAGFSCFYDYKNNCWWDDVINYVGTDISKLANIVEPNTIIGSILPKYSKLCNLSNNVKINIGLLDHFAGMIGTGNIEKGTISESAGTVLSLATLVDNPLPIGSNIPIYRGPFVNSFVLLPVCESGGICLEWFKNNFIKEMNFKQIDESIINKKLDKTEGNTPIFLPHIAGINAPQFNKKAKGVFFGFDLLNDELDFALCVMQGVAYMLKDNIEFLENKGIPINSIITTGGGAKSKLWNQIKSDITQKEITVPSNEEAPSLGAAILASMHNSDNVTLEDKILKVVAIKEKFLPKEKTKNKNKYELYKKLYEAILPIYDLTE